MSGLRNGSTAINLLKQKKKKKSQVKSKKDEKY